MPRQMAVATERWNRGIHLVRGLNTGLVCKFLNLLHQDVSLGNIIRFDDGSGMLIDREMAKTMKELDDAPVQPVRSSITITSKTLTNDCRGLANFFQQCCARFRARNISFRMTWTPSYMW